MNRVERWLLRQLEPNQSVEAVTELDPDTLWQQGLRGVALDFDNTIVAWHSPAPTAEVRDWLRRMQARGFRLTILSNAGRPKRVQRLAEETGLLYLARACKPFGFAYRRALWQLDLPPAQVAMVGDQLMTDVLGGNRAGLWTVLVKPLVNRDFPLTRLNRAIERRALAWLRGKGKLPET